MTEVRATTILCVRKGSQVAVAGDGQVTMGETIAKADAVKVRKLEGFGAEAAGVLVGFAGWVLLGQRVGALGALGLAAGFAGVAIIMGARLSQGIGLLGLLLCVLGVISLTAATMLVRSASSGGNILMIIGLQIGLNSYITRLESTLEDSMAANEPTPSELRRQRHRDAASTAPRPA